MIGCRAIFTDRTDAGKGLGVLLKTKIHDTRPLVLGIPTGGVQVAYEVAKILKGDLSVVIAKKLADPSSEEVAMGAIAEDDFIYFSRQWENLDQELKRSIIERQSREVQRRIARFRGGRPLPEMAGRTVLLVDDGIATGATIAVAILLCKTRNPERIIVAVPVAPNHDFYNIFKQADQVVILEQPSVFHAVGEFYGDFRNLPDEDLLVLLQEAGQSPGGNHGGWSI